MLFHEHTPRPHFTAMDKSPDVISAHDGMDEKWRQEASAPRGWPSGPATLRESSLSTWQQFLLSSSLVLIPTPFVVLAAYLVSLDQQAESELGSRVLEAANIAATLWPIAFAAVLGTALRSLALYSCERGTTLGTLEILLGSLTMTSTLKLLFWARLVSFWSPILILVWILSPLGGQSVLRAVSIHEDVTSSEFPIITYPSTNFTAGFDKLPVLYALPSSLRTVFGAAFSSSATRLMFVNGSSPNFRDSLEQVGGPDEARRLTQQDIWGNVRVPFLHMLEGYDASDPHIWVDVPNNTIPPYDSLVGVSIRGVPTTQAGNASMMVQSSYISLSCKPWINGSAWLQNNVSQLILAGPVAAEGKISVNYNNISFFSALRGDRDSSLGSGQDVPSFQFDLIKDAYLNATRWNGGNFSLVDGQDLPSKQSLVFFTSTTTNSGRDFHYNMTTCAPSTSYVDTMVRCSRPTNLGFLSCFVEKLRHTRGKPVEANATVLSFTHNLPILPLIPRLLPDPEGSTNDLLNLFLRDPAIARPVGEFYKFQELSRPPSLDNVSMSVFESRLAVVLNTVVRASFEQSIIVGADGISPSSQVITDNATGSTITPLSPWGNSTGIWEKLQLE